MHRQLRFDARSTLLGIAVLCAVSVVGCGENGAAVPDTPPIARDPVTAHRAATAAILAGIEKIVTALQEVVAGDLEADAAKRRIEAMQPNLDSAIADRNGLGPATEPAELAIYAELEPRRKQLFLTFNETCRKLRGNKDLLMAVQNRMFTAVEALAAQPR
ncbi:MAG: hypothetical protein KDC98_23150 [Planctomycetes bacterium]|nr:hypothetical protein [Planctomycetota bacterium]